MRRPIILATALAADLAVGTLLLAPVAAADDTVEPAGDPPVPPVEVPVRSGRSDEAPPAAPDPVEPGDAPVALPAPVRTGRVAPPSPDDATNTAPTADTEEPGAPRSVPTAEPESTGAPSAPRGRGSRRPTKTEPGRSTGAGAPTTDVSPTPTAPATPTTPVTGPAPAPASAPTSHAVVAGDNLWEIAATALAGATGRERRELAAIDIAPYWVRLCMTNRPRLRSGNPSLIYPGEVVELPPM